MFKDTTAGVNSEINKIDAQSSVQVFLGTLRFYIAVPGSAKSGGVRVLAGADTLDEALQIAGGLVPAYRAKMDRTRARALKLAASL